MSKRAEEKALEAYPVKMTPLVYQDLIDQFGGKTEIDVNTYPRCLFQESYEQAEKDLALTWEDIEKITDIHRDVLYNNPKRIMGAKENYEDTLKKFNEWREKK